MSISDFKKFTMAEVSLAFFSNNLHALYSRYHTRCFREIFVKELDFL